MDITTLEKMIAKGQDSAMLRLTLARLLSQAEQWDKAATHLLSALEQDPNYSAAWKALGQAHLSMGQNDAALSDWQQGIEAARANGDKQAEKEMDVFVRRLLKGLKNRGQKNRGKNRGQSQVPE
jgi:tetratricopeptide (TPR) repeat protein